MVHKLKGYINKALNYSIVGLALSIAISRAGISIFTFLILLLWIIEGNFKSKFNIIWSNNFLKMLVIFFIYMFLSLLWTTDLVFGLDYIRGYWILFTIFAISTSLKQEFILPSIYAFILGLGISVFISYGAFFELFIYKTTNPADPCPFMTHMDYSVLLAFGSIVMFIIAFTKQKINWLLITLFLATLIMLFIVQGRTGQLAFFITIPILFLYKYKVNILTVVGISLITILLFISIYSNSDNFKYRVDQAYNNVKLVVENQNYSTSIGTRIAMWIVASDIVQENPIFGVGVGDHKDEMQKLGETVYKQSMPIITANKYAHFHNQFLQIIVQFGLIGMIIFLLMFYYLLTLKLDNKIFDLVKISIVFIYLISFMGEPVLHKQTTEALFAIIASILIFMSTQKSIKV